MLSVVVSVDARMSGLGFRSRAVAAIALIPRRLDLRLERLRTRFRCVVTQVRYGSSAIQMHARDPLELLQVRLESRLLTRIVAVAKLDLENKVTDGRCVLTVIVLH